MMAEYQAAMAAIFERKSQLHEFDLRTKRTSNLDGRIVHVSMTYMLVLLPYCPSLHQSHVPTPLLNWPAMNQSFDLCHNISTKTTEIMTTRLELKGNQDALMPISELHSTMFA